MEKAEFRSRSEAQTEEIAGKILETCKNAKIFAIFGNLGAGKTALVKSFCRELHVEDAVKSPTFSIVNEYKAGREKVFHFDLYRIKNAAELFEIGFDEYLESGYYCFIEWPEIAADFLPAECAEISIETMPDEERVFTFLTPNLLS